MTSVNRHAVGFLRGRGKWKITLISILTRQSGRKELAKLCWNVCSHWFSSTHWNKKASVASGETIHQPERSSSNPWPRAFALLETSTSQIITSNSKKRWCTLQLTLRSYFHVDKERVKGRIFSSGSIITQKRECVRSARNLQRNQSSPSLWFSSNSKNGRESSMNKWIPKHTNKS